MNTEDFAVYSNIEVKYDIDQILSKSEFKEMKIPVFYLDRRSAELGYYFTHLQLHDVKENENKRF